MVLRAFELRDLDYFLSFFGDAAASEHVGGPSGREDTWRRMLAGAALWNLTGVGMWAVEERASGKLLGIVGFFNAWRDLEPEFGEEPEMGWIMAADSHGKGIASEACRAALEWAQANLKPTCIWAIIAPANEASIRLAEKLGFERVGETSYHNDPTLVFRRPAWG